MQLSDILEEQSPKNISKKTNISEENIVKILESDFETLDKAKAFGFISIIEREYNADLSVLRDAAEQYYAENRIEDRGITVGKPMDINKKGKPGWFKLLILGLLVYATWYFMTQYDKTHLNTLLHKAQGIQTKSFESLDSEAEASQRISLADSEPVEIVTEPIPSSVEETLKPVEEVAEPQSTPVTETVNDVVSDVEEKEIQIESDESVTISDETPALQKEISIIPAKKLWFGVIGMEDQKRDHFLVTEAYTFDLSAQGYLVATSSAGFALVDGEEKRDYSDAREHYFKIDQSGIKELTKDEYVVEGGWSQW